MSTDPSLDWLLAAIDALDADDDDAYPWSDAWTWTAEPPPPWRVEPDPDDAPCPVPRLPPRVPGETTLRAVLADGRLATWTEAAGWDGDTDVITAARAVAALHQAHGAMTAAARALIALGVDGNIDALVWVAARL